MTPSQSLKHKLNDRLSLQGMRIVGNLDWPTGSQRSLDSCRWSAMAGFKIGSGLGIWSVASWNTITECLRYGFTVEFKPTRGEADIMVSAKTDQRKP